MVLWMALLACEEIAWPWDGDVAVAHDGPDADHPHGALVEGCGPDTDPYDVVGEPSVAWPHALNLTFEHGGGCASHTFVMCWDETFYGADPTGTTVTIVHDDHDDGCDALLQTTASFDLGPIRAAYEDIYGDEAPIAITVNGPREPFVVLLED